MLYFPPFPPSPPPPPPLPSSPSMWGTMKRCSGRADVFSTMWTLSRISSALTSFTGHGWLRFSWKWQNEQDHGPSIPHVPNCHEAKEDLNHGCMAWISVDTVQACKIKVTLDRCCLWERLVLVHMFSIKRGWSCNADVMWDDRTHAVVKDSIALTEEDRVNGLQTGEVWISNSKTKTVSVW